MVNKIYFTFQQSYQVFPTHLTDQQEHPVSPPVQKMRIRWKMHNSDYGFCWQRLKATDLSFVHVNLTIWQNFIYLVENSSNSFTQELGHKKAFSNKGKWCAVSGLHVSVFLPVFTLSSIIKPHRTVFNQKKHWLERHTNNAHMQTSQIHWENQGKLHLFRRGCLSVFSVITEASLSQSHFWPTSALWITVSHNPIFIVLQHIAKSFPVMLSA